MKSFGNIGKDKKAGWDVGDQTESRLKLNAKVNSDRTEEQADTTMLDRILSGEKLWYTAASGHVQKNMMRKVREQISAEHDYLIDHEPQDQFHACVLLGALNLIEGLLDKRRKVKHGL